MNIKRYDELQSGEADTLTEEEIEDGWHWCPEMDDLLCIRGGPDCFCQ